MSMLLAVICGSSALHAQEAGQVPYAVIHKVVSRAQQVKHPKLRAVVRLQSKDKAAKSPTMVIQAKGGPITVAIGDDGEMRNFPVTEELLQENPLVVTNQPKGSSQLLVAMEAVVPEGTTYSYRELAQLLDAANAEIRKQAGVLAMMAPRAKALSFHFRGGGKQTVTVNRKQPQALTSDANGIVRLELDKAVVAEDPQVVVSEKPAKVLVN